ncbi:MAG: putative ATP-dependent endonuclease of OLD family [Vicingaceae bacterium]|jgi:predicted ATP-dependent endonuclease of OLD family
MKVNIQNLGAIKDATFDLSKRLIIFCGPNNSGKTYAAFIIYALTKASLKYFRSQVHVSFVQDLVKKQETVFNIPVNEIWNYRLNELKGIKNSLDSIFGITEDVQKTLFDDFSIDILQTKKQFEVGIPLMEFQNELKINNTSVIIKKVKGSTEIKLTIKEKSISKDKIDMLELFLTSKLYSLIAFYPFNSSHILPVERNSIYTFSKELSIQKQEFLDRAQELSSKNSNKDPFHWLMRRSTRYPMPIRDGLEIAEDLNNYSKTKTEFFTLAEEIENELLQGKMIVTKEGEVQYSSNKAKTKKIPIHLTASIVKTLSSLVFYLKHIANKNELIIIDEPELNLHPNNQVFLTRIFAKLINHGFRILISTHSDYVVREINNLIMASSEKPGVAEKAKQLGYTTDMNLTYDKVGAYLFKYKNKNSRKVSVSPIDVTDAGFDVETIDSTIDDLNLHSEELFYTMKYGVQK